MLLSIEAEEKCGKTTLAYTAPLPIIGFSFDMGSERALMGSAYDKYFKGLKINIVKDYAYEYKGEDILIYEVPIPIQLTDSISQCSELWAKFQACYVKAGLIPEVKSLVFDTATLVRKLAILSYMQFIQKKDSSRKQLLQIEYAHPNDEIRILWNFGKDMGKNLIGTHHLTDEYKMQVTSDGKKESQPTGEKILEGYNKTLQAVDVGIRLREDRNKIVGRVVTCGYDREMKGQDIEDPSWDKLVNLIELKLGGRIKLEKRNQ